MDDVAPQRFLRSKIAPPRLHADAVERPRLIDQLRSTDSPLWLLSAPAGYGKTTAVLQALDDIDGDVAWLSIDRVDNDPVRFWTHVAAALLDGSDGFVDLLDRLASQPDHIDAIVDELVVAVEARDHRVILVLDDMHEVHRPEIFESLSRIVDHPPANLTLVVITRADPALPVGRLRAQGRLHELRLADLAFTSDEAAAVFGDPIDADSFHSIVERTEGWPTALRLLAVSAGTVDSAEQLLQAADDARPDLADFLAGEALGVQPAEVQQFLIETSVLDDLCPEVCDAITGRPGSLATLRALTAKQVFTQLVDPATNTFRYHRLFRDFLRGRALELEPPRLKELHCAAARWFAERIDPTSTIQHAVAAEDRALARATIEEYYLPYSQAGLLPTVNDWLIAYGEDRCRADPELSIVAAWAALNARRYDEVEGWIEPWTDQGDPVQLAQVHAIRSHRARHFADVETALTEAGLGADQVRLWDDPTGGSFVLAALGTARVLGGLDDDGVLSTAINQGRVHDNDSAIFAGYAFLALAASEDEEHLDEAEGLADQALAFVTSPVLERFHQPAAPLFVKSRGALARGYVGDATELADRAEEIARWGAEPLLLALVHCQQARIAHVRGARQEVRARLRDAEALLGERSGAYLADVVRVTRNETRFAPLDDRHLPPGAAELTERELAVVHLLPTASAGKTWPRNSSSPRTR